MEVETHDFPIKIKGKVSQTCIFKQTSIESRTHPDYVVAQQWFANFVENFNQPAGSKKTLAVRLDSIDGMLLRIVDANRIKKFGCWCLQLEKPDFPDIIFAFDRVDVFLKRYPACAARLGRKTHKLADAKPANWNFYWPDVRFPVYPKFNEPAEHWLLDSDLNFVQDADCPILAIEFAKLRRKPTVITCLRDDAVHVFTRGEGLSPALHRTERFELAGPTFLFVNEKLLYISESHELSEAEKHHLQTVKFDVESKLAGVKKAGDLLTQNQVLASSLANIDRHGSFLDGDGRDKTITSLQSENGNLHRKLKDSQKNLHAFQETHKKYLDQETQFKDSNDKWIKFEFDTKAQQKHWETAVKERDEEIERLTKANDGLAEEIGQKRKMIEEVYVPEAKKLKTDNKALRTYLIEHVHMTLTTQMIQSGMLISGLTDLVGRNNIFDSHIKEFMQKTPDSGEIVRVGQDFLQTLTDAQKPTQPAAGGFDLDNIDEMIREMRT